MDPFNYESRLSVFTQDPPSSIGSLEFHIGGKPEPIWRAKLKQALARHPHLLEEDAVDFGCLVPKLLSSSNLTSFSDVICPDYEGLYWLEITHGNEEVSVPTHGSWFQYYAGDQEMIDHYVGEYLAESSGWLGWHVPMNAILQGDLNKLPPILSDTSSEPTSTPSTPTLHPGTSHRFGHTGQICQELANCPTPMRWLPSSPSIDISSPEVHWSEAQREPPSSTPSRPHSAKSWAMVVGSRLLGKIHHVEPTTPTPCKFDTAEWHNFYSDYV
ncbi:hypothetical protein DICA1_F13674 [Diutina catenulata]